MAGRAMGTLLARSGLVIAAAVLLLAGGIVAFFHLDIEAYPDPSPPMFDILAQYPGRSSEEVERYVTIPLETALAGLPGLRHVRSLSMYGLGDVNLQFAYSTDPHRDEQLVRNELAQLQLPDGVQPDISPESTVGEVYRYQLVAPRGFDVGELRALQDWTLQKRFRAVPGVNDVATWGGPAREYHIDLDLPRIQGLGLSIPSIAEAVAKGNANVGGRTLEIGEQSIAVRGIGLARTVDDLGLIVLDQRGSSPVLLRDVATISIGGQERLGSTGRDDQDSIIQGIVLMRRGEATQAVVERIEKEVEHINASGVLPKGVNVVPFYDRKDLIETTVHTVLRNLVTGMVLVFIIQFLFLGEIRSALAVAAAIPFSLFFSVLGMWLTGDQANLLSIGAIDFGIIVDANVIMVENIVRNLRQRKAGDDRDRTIAMAMGEIAPSVIFATLIILAAYIPLFTMHGVEGRIFAPMARTYAFALAGALLGAFTLSPVVTRLLSGRRQSEGETRIVSGLRRAYAPSLAFSIAHPAVALLGALGVVVLAVFALRCIGSEFLPKLEEGNLWVRATLPASGSLAAGEGPVREMRKILGAFPEVETVVSQHGRPDDGTDPSGFYSVELFVALAPSDSWPKGIDKRRLVEEMSRSLESRFTGIDFNFTQVIQDQVEEAVSGVKGENSVKVFGPDLDVLESRSSELKRLLEGVRGVVDVGVFHELGQPNLVIEADRARCARVGVNTGDVDDVVETAIGGKEVTEMLDGERRYPVLVRLAPKYRSDIAAIAAIPVATPSEARVPLGDLASIRIDGGATFIHRESGERFIPVQFAVRGRDLGGAVTEAQALVQRELKLPRGYSLQWSGEFGELSEAEQRLAWIVPISLAAIGLLLYAALDSLRDSLVVAAAVPLAASGGVLSLFLTRTPFSISAAIGFISLFGVAVMAGILLVGRYRALERQGMAPREALSTAAHQRLRPVLMTCLSACLGLMPAAFSHGMGSETQRPLARVIVGGMVFGPPLILLAIPALLSVMDRRHRRVDVTATGPAS